MKLGTYFSGSVLREALLRQQLVACDSRAAGQIAKCCKVTEYPPGTKLITEGSTTADVHLILRGTVDVLVKGNVVATRTEGQHIGEMAALLNGPRTATALARDTVIVARVRAPDFLALGNKFPSIWKGVARTLALRLDQRRDLIREPNIKPRIFIASAAESINVAHEVKTALRDSRWEIDVWDEDHIFGASEVTIEVLSQRASQSDFGIVIFGRDDKTLKRGATKDAPRDNCVLEGGMFIGAIGLQRTFFLVPGGVDLWKPTDLNGVTTLSYSKKRRSIDVSTAVKNIRNRIEKKGVR